MNKIHKLKFVNNNNNLVWLLNIVKGILISELNKEAN